MSNYELCLTPQGEENISETIDCLISAANEIVNASENDFNAIKNKKWYTRLWELITFNKDNQKIQARGVSNLAKLNEIIMKATVLVSKQGAETASTLKIAIEKINNNFNKEINQLTDNQILMFKAIKRLKWDYKEQLSIGDLTDETRNQFSSVLFKYIKSLDTDISKNQWAQNIFNLIYSPSTSFDVNYNILDSLNDDETILLYRLIQSYYYLATDSFDDESEILDFLRISRKDEKAVKADIEYSVKFLGKENYINTFDSIFEYNYVEDDDLIEWVFLDDFSEEETSFILFEDITISSMTHIAKDETLEYSHKNIEIKSIIHCLGTIVFENCNISYNIGSAKGEIVLDGTASLVAKNCTFLCEDKTNNYFIKSDFNCYVSFENCTFENCSYFIGEHTKEFLLVNSKILNCADKFINLFNYTSKQHHIVGNTIINEQLSSFNYEDYITLFRIHTSPNSNSDYDINNNLILEEEDFNKECSYRYFEIRNGYISNCTFIGTKHCILWALAVDNCVFENCEHVVSTHSDDDYHAVINQCLFKNCINSIDVSPDTTVSSCKFIDCKQRLIDGSSAWDGGIKVEFCEFLDCNDSGIYLTRSKSSKSKINKISNCLFDGIISSKYYLITTDCFAYEKPYDTIVSVNDCEFRNCQSNDKMINEYTEYQNVFGKSFEFKAVNISNCIGHENTLCPNPRCDKSTKEAALAFADKIGANINKNAI